MAARVGTGTTALNDADTATVVATRTGVTAGNLIVVQIKWELSGVTPTLSSVADGVNSFTILPTRLFSGTYFPAIALAYCIAASSADLTITATFAGNCVYKRLIVEEFSGLNTSDPEDQNEQTNEGTGSPFDTASINTSTSGLVFLAVGTLGTLTSPAGAGTPTFSLGASISDCSCAYLISGSAQTVTPSMTGTGGGGADCEIAQAFKDAAGGGGGGSTPVIVKSYMVGNWVR